MVGNFNQNLKKSWIVAVDMGYGHQRTAYPLREFAFEGKVINANSYAGIPEKDRRIWGSTREFYEFISRFKRIPLIGQSAFSFFDKFQKIQAFYPKKDLSKPNFSLKRTFSLFKKGWGRDFILKLNKNPLPLISTFFIPAFMAEFFGYKGEIFCVICDADISRTWASLKPKKSRIKYFTPNLRTTERLELYGVKKENIFYTGYPLPLENIGTENSEILKKDLGNRLLNLDPEKRYQQKYKVLIDKYLGGLPQNSDHVLTIMFSIGGAGAQKEIAVKIIKDLKEKIKAKEIKMILSAGIRKKIRDYFLDNIKELKMEDCLDKTLEIVFSEGITDYFRLFNEKLRKTDILWTKPSELSFYSALGLPVVLAPTIGSHENFNRDWLLGLGSGILQKNPNYTGQWLFDLLKEGRLAEAAMQGFVETESLGIYNIKRHILTADKI